MDPKMFIFATLMLLGFMNFCSAGHPKDECFGSRTGYNYARFDHQGKDGVVVKVPGKVCTDTVIDIDIATGSDPSKVFTFDLLICSKAQSDSNDFDKCDVALRLQTVHSKHCTAGTRRATQWVKFYNDPVKPLLDVLKFSSSTCTNSHHIQYVVKSATKIQGKFNLNHEIIFEDQKLGADEVTHFRLYPGHELKTIEFH